MQEIYEIIPRAFDTSGFPPRWYCGSWSSALGWLHIISDYLIFLAYLAIPLLLLYFLRRRPSIPSQFNTLVCLFAAFIICCGTGHLLEAIIFWHPVYRFAGIWKLVTATVSLATVVKLIPIIPEALKIPRVFETNRQLDRALSSINSLRIQQEEMAADVSHNLKEPVRSINYRLTKILNGLPDILPSEIAEELVQSKEQAIRLHEMVEQMVVHTSILSAKLELQSISIETAIRDAIDPIISDRLGYSWPGHSCKEKTLITDPKLLIAAIENCGNWLVETQDTLDFTLKDIELTIEPAESEPGTAQLIFTLANAKSTVFNNFQSLKQVFSPDKNDQRLAVAHRILRRLGGGICFIPQPITNELQFVASFSSHTEDDSGQQALQ